jgi:UDP-N-acetylglucosamine 1-carboxyvinyltransferase
VTGTANIMCAATMADGETLIEQAACEPEVVDLANFLIALGADVEGAGTPHIRIRGVKRLGGASHSVIPDRIEAETFLAAAAITQGDIIVDHCRPDHMVAVTEVLKETGATIDPAGPGRLRARGPRSIQPVDVTTFTYPGFPTDAQAQLMAVLTLADGISAVTEKVYPDRFMHVAEYMRMGATIRKVASTAVVKGVESLSGAPVMASDLRASAGLVLMGLAAIGQTEVHRIYHLDRGYEDLESKFIALGADIVRESYAPRRRTGDAATKAA